MQYRCEVYIRPRADILDPQGDAVNAALKNLNFQGVSEVKVGKYLTLTLEADNSQAAASQLDQMCQVLLANPIIEDYEIKVTQQQ
jgi:phosphoribosylformylglycinamidine synthase